MSGTIGGPLGVFLTVMLGSVAAIMALVVFAATGVGGATVSTAITSTGNTYISLLPYLGAMVAGAFVLIAVEGRKRR